MPIQDRTNEFRACVESIRSRSSLPARGSEAKQRLLQSQGSDGSSKSEFTRMATAIAKDISSATIKLGKLAQRTCPRYTILLPAHPIQSQNARPCSTTVQWRLAYVHQSLPIETV